MAGGLRASGPKADIALIVAEGGAVVGGAFTQNVMCAAPVSYCREVLAKQTTTKAVSPSPPPPSLGCPEKHPALGLLDICHWTGAPLMGPGAWGGGGTDPAKYV